MKEIDDTTPPNNEREKPEWFEKWLIATQMDVIKHLQSQVDRLKKQVDRLKKRVANLESQRTPADANMDDPEWY
jgi:polyhydroxyalkanoate synthesis regulator phasin